MKTFSFEKLSRSGIPSFMEENYGSKVYCKTMDDASYKKELSRKLLEEAQEVISAKSQEEIVEELADLQEVILSFRKAFSITEEEIEAVRLKKKKNFGDFDHRVYIEKVEHPEGSDGERYCLKQPEKYPILKK